MHKLQVVQTNINRHDCHSCPDLAANCVLEHVSDWRTAPIKRESERIVVARAQVAAKADPWLAPYGHGLWLHNDTELRLFSTKARFHVSRSKKPVQPYGLFY